LISKKLRVSLAKLPGRRGIFLSVPLDLDRTVRTQSGSDGPIWRQGWTVRTQSGSDGPIPIWDHSNLDRPFMIGRPGPIGAWGGGAVTPATPFRDSVARGSPDFTVNGALGVQSSGAWVCPDQRETRDPPGALFGNGGARGCARGGGGGSARRRSPACGVPAAETAYGLQHLA
jgi:hypothetical protein